MHAAARPDRTWPSPTSTPRTSTYHTSRPWRSTASVPGSLINTTWPPATALPWAFGAAADAYWTHTGDLDSYIDDLMGKAGRLPTSSDASLDVLRGAAEDPATWAETRILFLWQQAALKAYTGSMHEQQGTTPEEEPQPAQ